MKHSIGSVLSQHVKNFEKIKIAPVPVRFNGMAFVEACDSGRQQVPERLKVAWRKPRRIYDQTHRRGRFHLFVGVAITVHVWKKDKRRRWKYLRSNALTAGREEAGSSPISRFLHGPKPTEEWRELVNDLMGSLQDLSRDECALLEYLLCLHNTKSGYTTLKTAPFGKGDNRVLGSLIDSL